MRIPWLPTVLRDAGLQVALYDGWAERGNEKWGPLRGVVCHATASNINSTTAGDCRVLWVTGSVTAPVPISQMYLGRDGVWTVGATGRCNHVLTGDKGPHKGYGNSALIGIEAANNNLGEPWSAHMLDSYQRGVAAICAHMGWGAGVVVGHREHQTGKSDPLGIDMNAFRTRVSSLLGGDDDMTPAEHALLEDAAWRQDAAWAGSLVVRGGTYKGTPYQLNVTLKTINDKLDVLAAGGGDVDTAAVLAGVQKLLDEQTAALEESLPDAVVDEQHDRLAE